LIIAAVPVIIALVVVVVVTAVDVVVAPIDIIITPVDIFDGVVLQVGGVTIVRAGSPGGFLLKRDLLLQ
jgi:hypothetical protein